eukprot:scaffold9816_cov99-Skeletonema_dohrnii-CCMP3373.AAC.12
MSEEDSDQNMTMCCASCGVAEVDDIKLNKCAECDLVRYCSDECLKEHRRQHKEACVKRAAELRDELLFKQPESSHLGDCPICMLPLPLDTDFIIMSCCSKEMCDGCSRANKIREVKALMPRRTCPFCRKPVPSSKEERNRNRMKRIEANDPVAMSQEGAEQHRKGDYSNAFRFYKKAAELGDVEAHCQLAGLYHYGQGVEKDRGKVMYHLEEAAIGGHPTARYNLGCEGWNNDNNESAVKHWIIAANQGRDESIKAVMFAFKEGYVNKDDLAAALRAHQAAVDATKSPQREAAKIARI